MILLAIECSAGPVSATITQDGKILSSAFSNVKVTHSETLIPMVENVLSAAKLCINDIDCFALANGPGSFTGVRIGIAAVKGMAAPDKKPCCAVSTLLAMAVRFKGENAFICPVMDARRNQVYNALFEAKEGSVSRICEDRALSCEELANELKNINNKIIVCGDGAAVFAPFAEKAQNVYIQKGELGFQNATGVADAAYSMVLSGETVSPDELNPAYLRLPQAERELKLKHKD